MIWWGGWICWKRLKPTSTLKYNCNYKMSDACTLTMTEPHSAAHWHTGVVQLSFTDQYIIHDWLTEARAGSDLGANERVNWQVTAARNLSKISAAKPRNRRTKYGYAQKAFLAVPQGPICTRDK